MKKILFWSTMPLQIPVVIALTTVYGIFTWIGSFIEQVLSYFTYFEGWCYNLPEEGYDFKEGIWVAHWKLEDGKMVNITKEEP